jgi:hypothetical protein
MLLEGAGFDKCSAHAFSARLDIDRVPALPFLILSQTAFHGLNYFSPTTHVKA